MMNVELCLYVCPRAKYSGFFHWEMCISTQRYRSLRVHQHLSNAIASADKKHPFSAVKTPKPRELLPEI